MRKTLYTAATLWQGPYDNENVIYFAGITQKVYKNLKLVDSFDPDYAEKQAYKLVGTSEGDIDRIYLPKSTDNIVVTNAKTSISFGIDNDKNLLIFPENYITTNVEIDAVRVKLIQNYASIYKANTVSFDFVNDFEFFNEKAITSMISTDDGIFLAGVSGKIWFYDGYVISGPVFACEDTDLLPATSIIKHRFSFETEDYIYVASDKKPRLFRSKLSTAKNGTDWEQLYSQGELAASTGGILSMTSAFGKIFLGSRNNKVFIYSRSNSISLSSPTDMITEAVIENNVITETLTTETIINNNTGDLEGLIFDVKCLEFGRNQVFAGISNKPEIWTYSELELDNPEIDETWVKYDFDETFRNDPAPAQYYAYGSKSSRNDTNLAVAHYSDDSSIGHVKAALVLKGNTVTATGATTNGSRLFEFSDGSDWEQALSINLPDQNFINVKCATVSELYSLSDISTVDGYTLNNYDLVMVKDQSQSSSIDNGIYRLEFGNLVKYTGISVVENSEIIGFYIENGFVNGRSRYLLAASNFSENNFEIYKPKYTFQLECRNLAYTNAITCDPLEECTYLNSLLDNDKKVSSSTGYTGYQGFEIADLYGVFSLQFNTSELVLKSGNNEITKLLPVYGLQKNWRFSTSTGATSDGWIAGDFVSAMIGTTEAALDPYNNSYTKYCLRITPAAFGNPQISYSNLNIEVDPESVLKIRVKIPPVSQFGFQDAKINFYWSYNSAEFINSSYVNIETSTDYVEYTIKPIWKGVVDNIQVEFVNLPENAKRPTYLYVDYIKIVNENKIFDLNNSFSKIRVTVEDRDIKVYLGKQEYPIVYAKNFINIDNYNKKYINRDLYYDAYNKPYIKFGKIENTAGNSLMAYSNMSFIIGESYSPIKKKILGFHHSQKLPAASGVRLFSYHDGTIYCMTDGFDSNKVNINPDDRQAKIFQYDSTMESWINENLTFERKKIFNNDGTYNLYGIVRPITAISYKGLLYMSGQYGNIKVT